MPSPLASLWEGLQQGQEQKQKKAREIADKQAEQWTQNFKESQAKAEAKQADQDLKIRETQAKTAADYQILANKREEDREEEKKRADEIARIKAANQKTHWDNLDKLKDPEAIRAQIGKAAGAYISQGVPPKEAYRMATEDFREVQEAITPIGPAAGTLGQSLGLQSLGADGGLPVDKSPMAKVAPQGPLPGRDVPTPKSILEAGLLQARKHEQEALAKKHDQEAQLVQVNSEATRKVQEARASLTKAQEASVRENTKLVPFKIATEVARAAGLAASAKAVLQNADTNSAREHRIGIEDALKINAQDLTAKKNLSTQVGTARDRAVKLNEEVIKNVKEAARLDLQINAIDGKKKAGQSVPEDEANRATMIGMKAGYAKQLEDLSQKYKEANSEYLDTLKLATDHGITEPTHPSGAPDKKAMEANKRAVSQDAAKAHHILLRPAFIPGPNEQAPTSSFTLEKMLSGEKIAKAHGGNDPAKTVHKPGSGKNIERKRGKVVKQGTLPGGVHYSLEEK